MTCFKENCNYNPVTVGRYGYACYEIFLFIILKPCICELCNTEFDSPWKIDKVAFYKTSMRSYISFHWIREKSIFLYHSNPFINTSLHHEILNRWIPQTWRFHRKRHNHSFILFSFISFAESELMLFNILEFKFSRVRLISIHHKINHNSGLV